MSDDVADPLEHVLDFEIGRIGTLELERISGLGREQQVRTPSHRPPSVPR
jgi:hypothetical protein